MLRKLLLPVIAGLLVFACDVNKDHQQTGTFKVTIENAGMAHPAVKSGVFNTPVSANDPGPILPGQAYEFEFTAPVGAHLTLATMFAQSNDWFYATDEQGIALYQSDGNKVTGDVTSMIHLYDAGTEMDQEPGTGSNQAPRQSAPNTGPDDSNMNVREVNMDGIPSTDQVIKVTLMETGTYGFKVRIENESDNMTLQTSEGGKPVPLSPGVFVVHSAQQTGLLFQTGQKDYGDGLEHIAEDGDPSMLGEHLDSITGLTVPFSPLAYAVYKGDNPIFMEGKPAEGNGLEAVAEDGDPSMLGTALASEDMVSASGTVDTPEGSSEAGILLPGQKYSFTFEATEGDHLTFASMFAQSNDVFFTPGAMGLALFKNGTPVTGDVSSQIELWDSGTEMNEEPGIGSYQAPRQDAPDTGPADSNPNVRMVDDGYSYPTNMKVTIEMVK